MKKSRQDGGSSESVTANGRNLAQLRQFSALLGRLPRDCSTTLGSHTLTGTGPDNRTLTFASYAGLVLLGVLHEAIDSLRDPPRPRERVFSLAAQQELRPPECWSFESRKKP